MTNRIHTNDNYRTVGVLEVLNEPDRENGEDMRKNYYPLALKAIRDAEKGVANGDVLKVQFMVYTRVRMMPGNADEISHSPKPGDPEIRTNSCQSHLMQTCCTTTIGTVIPDSTIASSGEANPFLMRQILRIPRRWRQAVQARVAQ